MKRIIILSTLFFAVLMTLSACSKTPVNSNNPNPQDSENSKQRVGSPQPRMPDFGQPDREADIQGVVKSVAGNEVAVLKVEMKGGRGQNASSTPEGDNASNTRQRPAVSLSGARGGMPAGAGGGAGGPGMPGGSGTSDRAAMLERIKAMSTGEETIVIPVGIKMLKSDIDNSTNKRTMVEASLGDIVSDKSITIWLNAAVTDKKVAEFVLIN